jgi:glc operon protein GlcG
VEIQVTLAHENKWTNLIGGIPIRVDGFVLGAVAAGSGTGAQDLAVARAGAAAIEGADMFSDFERWAQNTPASFAAAHRIRCVADMI